MSKRLAHIALPCLLAFLITSPVLTLVIAAFLAPPSHLSGAEYSSWQSQHIPTVIQVWAVAAFGYFVGCWLVLLFLQRGIIRNRAAILWWLSILCGALLALFFPIGTIISVPTVIMLVKKRAVYFHKEEPSVN